MLKGTTMNWHDRRLFRVDVNHQALTEVELMAHGLSRDAAGFAELMRRIAQKKTDLATLRDAWRGQVASDADVVEHS